MTMQVETTIEAETIDVRAGKLLQSLGVDWKNIDITCNAKTETDRVVIEFVHGKLSDYRDAFIAVSKAKLELNRKECELTKARVCLEAAVDIVGQ